MQPGSFAKITSTVVAVILIGTVVWLRTQSPSTNGHIPGCLGRIANIRATMILVTTRSSVVTPSDVTLVVLTNSWSRGLRESLTSAPLQPTTIAWLLRKRSVRRSTQEKSRVESWLNRSDSHPNLALQFHGHNPIGRSIRRGDHASQPCYDAAVILRWDGDHRFHVLTTYPEPARAR